MIITVLCLVSASLGACLGAAIMACMGAAKNADQREFVGRL